MKHIACWIGILKEAKGLLGNEGSHAIVVLVSACFNQVCK